jgi:hypothetical protein
MAVCVAGVCNLWMVHLVKQCGINRELMPKEQYL